MALRFPLPKRSQASLEQQTKTEGAEQPPRPALTVGQGSHRPPELVKGWSPQLPVAGAVPSPDPKQTLANPQNFSSVCEMKKKKYPRAGFAQDLEQQHRDSVYQQMNEELGSSPREFPWAYQFW